MGERVVQSLGVVTLQGREQLSFHPALEIGAGLRSGYIELRSNRKRVAHKIPSGTRVIGTITRGKACAKPPLRHAVKSVLRG